MDCLKIETIGMHLLRGTLDTVGTLLLLAWTFTGFSSNFFVLNFARWKRLHSKPVFRFCPFFKCFIQPHNFEQRVLTWQETTIWSCICSKTFDHLNLKFQNNFFSLELQWRTVLIPLLLRCLPPPAVRTRCTAACTTRTSTSWSERRHSVHRQLRYKINDQL